MTEVAIVFYIAKQVVGEVAPNELVAFDVFQEYFSQQTFDWNKHTTNTGKSDIGFDFGDAITFLTPWVIIAVKETITLTREVILEIIKTRITAGLEEEQAISLPLKRDEVSARSLAQLENELIVFLRGRGFNHKEVRRITTATLQAVLFEPEIALRVRGLTIRDNNQPT